MRILGDTESLSKANNKIYKISDIQTQLWVSYKSYFEPFAHLTNEIERFALPIHLDLLQLVSQSV